MKGDPVAIVCQNINYFIGGPADIWRNSEDKFGLEVFEPGLDTTDKKAVEVLFFLLIKKKNEIDKQKFREIFKNSEQKFNDQKLEFFTYTSTWKLGCLKVASSDAEKIYHGGTPIIINFKETPSKVKNF